MFVFKGELSFKLTSVCLRYILYVYVNIHSYTCVLRWNISKKGLVRAIPNVYSGTDVNNTAVDIVILDQSVTEQAIPALVLFVCIF